MTEKLRDTEAQTRVTLYQGLPKADKMEWIVQKSTELGAAAIAPVAMIRSVVKLEGKDAAKKTERWQKIAREAVKQCARVNAPEVKMPRKLVAMKDELNALDVLIVPWEDARDGSIADCLAPFKAKECVSIGILIGPEGGIAPEEAEWLTHEAGAKLVTLGRAFCARKPRRLPARPSSWRFAAKWNKELKHCQNRKQSPFIPLDVR